MAACEQRLDHPHRAVIVRMRVQPGQGAVRDHHRDRRVDDAASEQGLVGLRHHRVPLVGPQPCETSSGRTLEHRRVGVVVAQQPPNDNVHRVIAFRGVQRGDHHFGAYRQLRCLRLVATEQSQSQIDGPGRVGMHDQPLRCDVDGPADHEGRTPRQTGFISDCAEARNDSRRVVVRATPTGRFTPPGAGETSGVE